MWQKGRKHLIVVNDKIKKTETTKGKSTPADWRLSNTFAHSMK